MKEAYVSYEVAELLKEKGFDWECRSFYEYFSSMITMYQGMLPELSEAARNYNKKECEDICSRPTQQMACRWLREEHNIHIEPHFLRASGDYVYDIIHSPLELDDMHSFPTVFNTKEDAVEAALQYVLTNLI